MNTLIVYRALAAAEVVFQTTQVNHKETKQVLTTLISNYKVNKKYFLSPDLDCLLGPPEIIQNKAS